MTKPLNRFKKEYITGLSVLVVLILAGLAAAGRDVVIVAGVPEIGFHVPRSVGYAALLGRAAPTPPPPGSPPPSTTWWTS